uniref:Uncharacterized protein n=1 Tax=Anguilla anguilla TaxID=7936 RepID=A0A0E9PKE0_ANGAN
MVRCFNCTFYCWRRRHWKYKRMKEGVRSVDEKISSLMSDLICDARTGRRRTESSRPLSCLSVFTTKLIIDLH